jgi:hypothetical protein
MNGGLRVAWDASLNANLYVAGAIVNTGLTNALALKANIAAPSFTGLVISAGDVSLNAGLRVASDSSFNANLYVGGSIVNTGLTNALALKANIAAPSFTGLVVSAGDVSLNSGLRVASDSSFNANLYVGGSIVNTGLTGALALKANIAAPSFTGMVVSAGDVSLNAGLTVALDSSFNANLYVGGSIVNTGLTSDMALKANIAAPSFTGLVISAGDVSMNAGLTVALDSSFNANLYVGGSIVNTGLSDSLALKAPLASPTFTGTLTAPTLSVTSSTESSSKTTGALTVLGGAGIGGNVEVGGNIKIASATASTNSSTGALIVGGGVGIDGVLNTNNNITTSGVINTTNNTGAVSTSTGAIIVNGGVGVGGTVWSNRLFVNLDSSINSSLNVGGNLVVSGSIVSPALTGTPSAPTASGGTNTTQIATTEYVRSEINTLISGALPAFDTLNELAIALGNDAAFSTTVTNSLALKAPSASPTFTGNFLVSSADASFNGNLYVAGAIVNTDCH